MKIDLYARPLAKANRERSKIFANLCKNNMVLEVGYLGLDNPKSISYAIKHAALGWCGVNSDYDLHIKEAPYVSGGKITDMFESYAAEFEDFRHMLQRKFHIVVMGEVIEHSERPGAMLESAKYHLASGGKILLSTPNANWRYKALLTLLRKGDAPLDKTHVALYDAHMLTRLAHNHHLKIEFIGGVWGPQLVCLLH